MITEPIPTDYDMDAQEWAEFQRDYDRWCLEVELDRVRILDNAESRTKTVNQNS
jgi:hypothetical protein